MPGSAVLASNRQTAAESKISRNTLSAVGRRQLDQDGGRSSRLATSYNCPSFCTVTLRPLGFHPHSRYQPCNYECDYQKDKQHQDIEWIGNSKRKQWRQKKEIQTSCSGHCDDS